MPKLGDNAVSVRVKSIRKDASTQLMRGWINARKFAKRAFASIAHRPQRVQLKDSAKEIVILARTDARGQVLDLNGNVRGTITNANAIASSGNVR